MYARMIARDCNRNRGVTILLVVLMMLSVVLATASAGTLVRLVGASDNLLDQARAPHVAQLHAGEYDSGLVEEWVAGRDDVEHHQAMFMLGIDGAHLFFDGAAQTANIQQNALVVPNPTHDVLLDLDNRPITGVAPGSIVLPVYYDVETELMAGDQVVITAADGFRKEFVVAGFARDAIMNPAVASSKRLAVAASDLAEVAAHTGSPEYLIEFWLEDPAAQTAAFEKAYLDSDLPRAGQMVDAATFRLFTMIGDGLVAAVVILVSVLLLAVGMLCLRFAFLTAAEQDRREIGVLKAIGVPAGETKGTYLVKYAMLAALATVLGLLAGRLLIPVLTSSITRYMGLVPSNWDWATPALAAVGVFAILVGFVGLLLRRFDAMSAVEALGPGALGRPVARWLRPRLHRSRLPLNLTLGAVDVVGRLPTYLLLVGVFAVSTFIMVVPVSSAATANAPDFIRYMGTGPVDLRIDLRQSDDGTAGRFEAAVAQLGSDPEVAAIAPMVTTRHAILDDGGNEASLYVENGDHAALPVTYADGRAPASDSEIALSLLALNQAGLTVGDRLPLEYAGKWRELLVVGSYQDITNGGRTAKSMLQTDGEEVMWYVVGVDLAAGADVSAKAEQLSSDLAPATVADIGQWRSQTLGPIAGQLGGAAAVAAVAAVLLAVVMTALFTRMLVARDAAPIALQRALGMGEAGIRAQYLTRILLVLLVGVIVGSVAANTLGEGVFNLMFEAMFGGLETLGQGISRIAFDVNPLLTRLALPLVLLAAVALAAVGALRTGRSQTISTLTTE